uniref:MGC64596 protein n=1 Tax=Xenopus laevis TaxID=8355 RepID=Q7SYP3_XENLA|nr:uncharacterized protein LOC379500 [Xenopus laevis]AAH54320.1 MGC64596 protein [Xenopus laevis]
MAPRKSTRQDKKPKRTPPVLTPEQKKKRAFQRAQLEEEMKIMSSGNHADNCLLYEPVLRERAQRQSCQPPATVRVGNTNWCVCGHCCPMPTEEESICCMEIENLQGIVTEDITCITEHPQFDEYCQNKSNLKMCLLFSGKWRTQRTPEHNREFRKAAYRLFTRWIHGFLGPKHRRPIPSCVVRKVRNIFLEHNNRYTGFYVSSDYCAADMADE